jgi:predicted 3-demethylubiquinone-9 3-methyltransferase (glyoxalase superfamily)
MCILAESFPSWRRAREPPSATAEKGRVTVQKITPHLWFDTQAREAAEFYVSAFGGDSRVTSTTPIADTPSGDAELVTFRLLGYDFMAISAGPLFAFNPSISFMVHFDPSRRDALDGLWARLAEGGTPLMPLGQYPFSERYGWIADRYGVTWQLILSPATAERSLTIMPSLMFTRDACGKAEEAMRLYTSIFPDSGIGTIARYGPEHAPDEVGTVMFEDFSLGGQWFAAMDSGRRHDFAFNEAISLVVSCDTQDEIDRYWEKLSAVPQAERCGWCKDAYGVSWQIVPSAMGRLMGGTADQRARVTQAFLQMKKFDIAALERAYAGTT